MNCMTATRLEKKLVDGIQQRKQTTYSREEQCINSKKTLSSLRVGRDSRDVNELDIEWASSEMSHH